MKRLHRDLHTLFGLPTSVTKVALWEYLRFPALIALLVLALYVATLGAVAWFSDLTLELVFSAGQVFTGLAGIGAAVVAIGGLAKQFQTPWATFSINVVPLNSVLSEVQDLILVTNTGDAPARNVRLGVVGSSNLGLVVERPWSLLNQSPDGVITRLFMEQFPPGTEALTVSSPVQLVSVGATGVAEVVWDRQ